MRTFPLDVVPGVFLENGVGDGEAFTISPYDALKDWEDHEGAIEEERRRRVGSRHGGSKSRAESRRSSSEASRRVARYAALALDSLILSTPLPCSYVQVSFPSASPQNP